MSKDTNARILKALAEKVFLVPVGNVATVSGIGQSGLLNHQVMLAEQRPSVVFWYEFLPEVLLCTEVAKAASSVHTTC